MVWLRLDVDNPCYYGNRARVRARWNLPIPGYFEDTKETLTFLNENYPCLKRVWFIRHCLLPPRGLLDAEEIGLHVTEPRNMVDEYYAVSNRFKRPLLKFTRHGHSKIASGRAWTKADYEYIHELRPWMVDVTDGKHYSVHRNPLTKLDVEHHSTDWSNLDHVLFHPVHFHVAKEELIDALNKL